MYNTGDLGLAPGPLAHRTPTDVVAPGAEAQALAAKNDAEVVYLDDGRTRKRRAGAVVVLRSRHGQDSESEASADASSEAPSDGSAGPSTKVGAISSSIEV